MKVYLSGPISDCTYKGATGWREAVADELRQAGYTALDPMRGKSFLSNQKRIEREVYEGMHDPRLSDEALYQRDLADVTACDILLCNLSGATKVSIGSMFEVAWGALLHKIVVGVWDAGDIHDHPFPRRATIVFRSLEAAMEYILSCHVQPIEECGVCDAVH